MVFECDSKNKNFTLRFFNLIRGCQECLRESSNTRYIAKININAKADQNINYKTDYTGELS